MSTENENNQPTEGNADLSLFERRTVRRIWHKDEWYYSIVDVLAVLTDSSNPSSYWYALKKRVSNEGFDEALRQIEPIRLRSADGRMRLTDTANRQTLLRLIQSVPSSKAEPLRLWLAQVGEERFEEIENPEQTLERIRAIYKAKGYDDTWIEERIKNNLVRNELTDEWRARGAKEGVEYAILTNEISEGTFDLTVQAYKEYKLLPPKENLRDHMSTMELVLCSLGEATAALYHRNRDSLGFDSLRRDTKDAGEIAGETRKRIEENMGGQSVVTSDNHLEKIKEYNEAEKLKRQEEKKRLRQSESGQLSLFGDDNKDGKEEK